MIDPLVTEAQQKMAPRLTGSVGGEAAEKIRILAKGIGCGYRELVEAILTLSDPAPAVRHILAKRRQEEIDKIEDLKKKWGG